MDTHKALVTAALLLLPAAVFAASQYNPQSVGAGNPEIHIRQDGTALVRAGQVTQLIGTTLYFSVSWGDVPIRFTVKTSEKTAVTKRYGGSATVPDIKVGDYLDVEGEFFVGSDFFGVQALRIKDWSLQEESGTYSGVITEMNAASFMLKTPQQQTITVRLSPSGRITKGSVALPFGRLQKGDRVLRAAGVYDYASNVLTASELAIFQAQHEFAARNYQGVLKRVGGTSIPTTLTVNVGGTDYTVALSEKSLVLKKNRKPIELARFVAGDTVRFYGPLRETEKTLQDALVVDAEIIRNMDL